MTDRVDYLSSLFSGARQYENFARQAEIFPVATMRPAPQPFEFPDGAPMALPGTYVFQGETRDSEAFLAKTDTMALLVLKDSAVRFERYALGGTRQTPWVSMSVAKSFVSAALGIAVGEGAIRSVEEPVTDYLPELKGSAYDGVRIKDILQMSSGAGWNEDYSDENSDINRFITIFATGGSFNTFAATLKPARAPGSYNLYNSTDTQVLGMLLKQATGQSIRDYLEARIWHPLGMESPGHWLIDSEGMEMAFGGLNATARDYAKIGELFRNHGAWQGKQIVPAAWVRDSVTPDGPHLQPGDTSQSDSMLGYGYQWWVMDGDEGEYAAIGVYNQFVYVNPARGVTIVKLSANPDYGLTNDETSYREFETIELLRAIARAA